MKYEKCKRCGERAGWISIFGNIFLAALKAIVAHYSGSKALMADAIHSTTDIVGSFITMLGLRVTNRGPDEDHPYGHGKVEFVTSAVVYLILIVVGFIIFVDSLEDVISGVTHRPRIIALLAAGFSIIYCDLIARFMFCAGREVESPSINALGWEQRFDCFSSIAVFIGILLAKLGLEFMDPLAAMFVGILIIKNCLVNLWSATSGLIDTSLSDEKNVRIKKLALEVEGVKGVGYIHTRSIGQKIEAEMEILLDPMLSIEKAEVIRENLIKHLKGSMNNLEIVHCHISQSKRHKDKKERQASRVVSMLKSFSQ